MYSEEAVKCFLKEQSRLFDEPVAETAEEAREFLEECMAVEADSLKEVRRYLDEAGARCGRNVRRRTERRVGSVRAAFRKISDRGRMNRDRKTEIT